MNQNTKVIILSGIGAIFEYYDFIIYGMMGIYLSEVFFGQDPGKVAFFKTFSVFVSAYLVRPFGGYIFGVIGDLFGRKKAMLLAITTMAFATLLIGCLPSYNTIGYLAPLLLVIARIFQGLSFGAEMPNATTIVKEFASESALGKYLGLIISGTGIGALLASITVVILARSLGRDAIIAWAWRLPFLFGGISACIVLILRKQMSESAIFLQYQKTGKLFKKHLQILQTFFKENTLRSIITIVIVLFFADLIIFSVYLPKYLHQYYGVAAELIYYYQAIGIALTIFLAPLFGMSFLAVSRISVLQIIAILYLVLVIYLLHGIDSHFGRLGFFLILGYQIIITAYSVNMLIVLAHIFPVELRATGLGISYNVAYVIAGIKQLILQANLTTENHQFLIIMTTFLVSGIVILANLALQKTQGQISGLCSCHA